MTKLKIKLTFEVEYEANPAHYPEGSTPEQMLEIDMKNAEDDPYLFIDTPNVKLAKTGEVVK